MTAPFMLSMPNTNLGDELLKNPEKMRVILDAANISINYCSADQVFLFVNQAYAQWYGRTPEEIIGTSIVDLLGEEGNKTIRPYYERALQGHSVHYETEVNLSIGYRYMQCNYTPVYNESGDTVIGWVGIIHDMTQRHLLEKALQENEIALKLAKEKAELANIAKSEFLANMSHEIRTPMNAVIGLAHILALSQPLTPKQKEFIRTLQMSADSLLDLINDLLDIEKIEARTVDLEKIPFSMAKLVQEVISMLQPRAKEKGLTLSDHCAAIKHQTFIGDPTRIRQILVNLCSNAIKFTETGLVTIHITSGQLENTTQHIEISIVDTGIGISVEQMGTIFQKFVQGDSSINRKYGGTGLGLAITKMLTEIMGGTIRVSSNVEQGCTFTVNLPLELAQSSLEKAREPVEKQASIASDGEEKPCVLLVEDYPANILVATMFLEEFGYRYDVATNGLEAIEKVKTGKYLAALMDVQMHGLNGLEATVHIREYERQQNLPKLPIIGMTAHALSGDRERCLAAGMNDYIAKPFDPNELERKLHLIHVSASA